MAKRKTEQRVADPDWGLVYRFATALEKGGFKDYLTTLSDTKKLAWKAFVSGLAKGLGAVIGGTVFVGLLAALLALIGPHLPDPAGKTVEDAGKKITEPAR